MDPVYEIETMPIRLTERRRSVWLNIEATNEERLLVRLRTEAGVEGWGEATALAMWGGMQGRYFGETTATVTHVVHDVLAAAVLGTDPREPDPLMRKLDDLIVGHPYAKAALEMALQDVRGKMLAEPLYRLLGGACRAGVRVAHMIGIMTEQEALAEADVAASLDGVTAFQVKGGEDVDRDVELIRALRRAFPQSFLRLDANQGYGREPKFVASAARRLEEAGADAVEQPAASVDALAACCAAVTIPIIADEGCWLAVDVLELWRRRAADGVSVYVAKAGGIARAAFVAATASLVGLSCDLNGSLETGVGTAASIHVALAAPNATLPSVIPVPSGTENRMTQVAARYFEEDVLAGGLTYANGLLFVGDAPGLGIDVDLKLVQKVGIPGGRTTSLPKVIL